MSGLKENKIKKTPEQLKKLRAARIKAHAENIFAGGLGAMLSTPGTIAQLNSFGENHEQRLAYLRIKAQAFSEVAINAATEFESEWKKKKGAFLHDDV